MSGRLVARRRRRQLEDRPGAAARGRRGARAGPRRRQLAAPHRARRHHRAARGAARGRARTRGARRRRRAAVGHLLLAGLDLPVEEERLHAAVDGRWADRLSVGNDTFAVLRAGTERGWGVAVVCGAGINCVGVGPDGRHVRFPALGAISGDWGGGYDVGLAALSAAVRSEDGRGPRTTLERAVPEHFGLATPGELVEAIHLGRVAQRRIIELPPLVFDAAASDPVAAAIVDRLAAEVLALVRASIERLELGGAAVEVLLGGGMFRTGDGRLLGAIEAGLRAGGGAARGHLASRSWARRCWGSTSSAPGRRRSRGRAVNSGRWRCMAEVRFVQATRTYPGSDEPAVDALDLEIADGELMVLVGPSGSGKTTALRMLAGLEEVDAGAIHIGERDVSDDPPKRRDVAMVFQNYALYPYLTVAANIGFPLRMARVPKADREERVRKVAEQLELTPLPRAQARPALRRPAPARGDGARDHPPAAGLPDGRAALQPRREAARADARRHRRAAGAPRRHHRLRHARPGRGDDARPPRRRAARREAAAVRHAARAVRPPGEHVRRRLRRLAGDEPLPRAAGRRRHAPRSAGCRSSCPACAPTAAPRRSSASGRRRWSSRARGSTPGSR